MKKNFGWSYVVFVLLLALTACATPAQAQAVPVVPTAESTPTVPEDYSGTVTVFYQYDELPTWLDEEILPVSEVMPITFSSEEGWSRVEISMIPYGNVEFFSLEALPRTDNFDGALLGGCYWEMRGGRYDDDVVYSEFFSPDTLRSACTSLKDAVLPNVAVSMAYCYSFEAGWLCHKQGLTVAIAPDAESISFTAEEVFLPQYRIWVAQVAEFFGLGELPEELRPDYNYQLK